MSTRFWLLICKIAIDISCSIETFKTCIFYNPAKSLVACFANKAKTETLLYWEIYQKMIMH